MCINMCKLELRLWFWLPYFNGKCPSNSSAINKTLVRTKGHVYLAVGTDSVVCASCLYQPQLGMYNDAGAAQPLECNKIIILMQPL